MKHRLKRRYPPGTHDGKGRILCPFCQAVHAVPPDGWLSRGTVPCPCGKTFSIDDDLSFQVNEHLARERAGNWRKDVLKNVEGSTPEEKEIQGQLEEGTIILPD